MPLARSRCFVLAPALALATTGFALSTPRIARAQDAPPTPTADITAALARLNTVRALAHLAPVALDPSLTRACALHANYLVTNEGRPEIAGLRAHEEVRSLPGYTDEGAAAGRASDIASEPAPSAVEAWVDSLYHRTPILRPSLRRVGLASAGAGEHVRTVLMFDAGTDTPQGYPLVYPVDGQTGVPLAFSNESPSPVPAPDPLSAGSPVTLAFGPLNAPVVTAQLTDAAGNPVPFWLSTPQQPATDFDQGNVVCMIPREHLRPGTTYHARIVAPGYPPFDWRLTTVAPAPVSTADFAAAAQLDDRLVSVRGDVLSAGTIAGNHYLEIARSGSRSMYVLIPDAMWSQLGARGWRSEADLVSQRVDVVGVLNRSADGAITITLNAPVDLQVSSAPLVTVDAASPDLLASVGRLVLVRGRVTSQGRIPGYAYLQLARPDGRMVSVMIPDALWASVAQTAPATPVGSTVTVRTTPQVMDDGSVNLDVSQPAQLTWSRP